MSSMPAAKSPNNSVLASTLNPCSLLAGWIPREQDDERTPADRPCDTDAAGHESQQSAVSGAVTVLTAWSGVPNCSLDVTCISTNLAGQKKEEIIKLPWLGDSHKDRV